MTITAGTRSAGLHFFQSATKSRIGTAAFGSARNCARDGRARAAIARYTRLRCRRSATCFTHIRIFDLSLRRPGAGFKCARTNVQDGGLWSGVECGSGPRAQRARPRHRRGRAPQDHQGVADPSYARPSSDKGAACPQHSRDSPRSLRLSFYSKRDAASTSAEPSAPRTFPPTLN